MLQDFGVVGVGIRNLIQATLEAFAASPPFTVHILTKQLPPWMVE